MEESKQSFTNGLAADTANLGRVKHKKRLRKQYASPIQSNESRTILTIQAKVSSTPKSCSDSSFPLFRPFVLSQESDVLYIKTSKRCIVNLSNGEKFSPNVSGYLVIL